jgi:S-(hydroxymethyl)glutathione dehydrogenase/alcohol dehydrogenase
MLQMKAAVLYGPNEELRVEDVTIDDPQDHEVRVKLVATGLCHSDFHVLRAAVPSPFPIVLGHEGAGIVDKVGQGVTSVKPGDHVILPVIFTCGRCRYCVEGQPALCSEVLPAHLMGTLPGGGRRLRKNSQDLHIFYSQGSFAEYVVVHERTAVKVRDDVPLEVACLFSCGVTTGLGSVINRAALRSGETIVVYGCGGVGLSCIIGAKLAGAGKIVAVDVLDHKLELAEELGADFLINAAKEDPQQRVMQITSGGADYAIESVGNVKIMAQAFGSIHSAGTCVLVGAAPMLDVLGLFPYEFLLGKTLKGSLLGNVRTSLDIPRYVDMYMEGKIPVQKLVSKYYTLEQINKAVDAVEKGQVVRAIIRF